MSERRACRFAGQHRSTQRHEAVVADDDAALRARLRGSRGSGRGGGIAGRTPLLGEGWELNRKRTQRLWREEGLRVPQRRQSVSGWVTRRCRRAGCARSAPIRCGRSTSSGIRPPTGTTSSCCTSWTSSPARRWRSSAPAHRRRRTVAMLDRLAEPRLRAGVHALRQRAGDDRERAAGLVPVLPRRERLHRARHRRGRTPTSRGSAAASATSSSPSSCSPASPRPRSWSRTGARTTTTTAPTQRSA